MHLAKVRAIDVRRFVAELSNGGLSPSRVRSTYFLVQAIFRAAVESGYIGRSPCVGVKLPRSVVREMNFISADQVKAIGFAVPEQYEALIHVLAFGGLRWGEAAALRRKRVNVLRRRVEVAESLADVDGELIFGPTKTHQTRVITLPKKTTEMLRLHLERFVEADRNALVFTSPQGDPLRSPNFRRRVWWPALDEAGVSREVRIHDLRHTCASLMIMQGAHPKEIQHQLGHSSISVTLDRYGHLFASAGLLYLAFTYGSAPVAASLVFSCVFFNLAIGFIAGNHKSKYVESLGSLVATFAVYLGGLGALVFARGQSVASGAAHPSLGLTTVLGLAAGFALAWFLWSSDKPDCDREGRATPVNTMTTLLAGAAALVWLMLHDSGGPPLTNAAWPLLAFGILTWIGTEALFKARGIAHTAKSAALASEPLFVLAYAVAIPMFAPQLPDAGWDRVVQVSACTVMALGAVGCALLSPERDA